MTNAPPRLGRRRPSATIKSLGVLCVLGAPLHAADKITFDDHVFPIFEASCLNCHNPDKKKGDLDLSNYTGVMAGGSGGAVAEVGDGAGSKIYASVTHTAEPFMPPKGDKIAKKDADMIRAWIDGGLLENKSSAAKKRSGPRIAKLDVDPSAKPEGPPPMPVHLSLEPVVVAKRGTVINDMACSPWAPLLAITGQKQILLYNTDTLRLAAVLPFPKGFPETLSFHPTGKYLMAGGGIAGKSGTTYTWEVPTGDLVMENGREFDSVLAASLRLDLGGVAMGGPSRLIKLWDTQAGEQIKSIKKHTDWVTALAYSPDGVLLATGDRNGGAWVWEAHTGNEFHTLRGHTKGITSITWRADSNLLATASEDGQVIFWELNNGGQVKKFAAHGGGALSFDWARNGEFVTSGRDRKVKIWKSDFNLKKELPTFNEMVVEVAVTSDGKRVFTADWNGKIEAWDGATFEKLGELSSNPPRLADRIAALETSVAEAPRTTAAAKGKLDAATKAVTDAQAALQQTITNRDNAKKRIAALNAEMTKTDQEIKRLTQERPVLIKTRDTRQAELRQAEERVTDHKQSIANAAMEVKQNEVGPAEAEEKKLAAEAKRLRDASNAKPEDAALKQQADQADQKLAAHRTMLAERRTKLAAAQANLKKLNDELPGFASQTGPPQAALNEALAKLKKLDADNKTLTERRTKIGPETQSVTAQLAVLEKAIKPSQDSVAARTKAVAEPKAAWSKTKAAEDSLKAELKFWQAALANELALAVAAKHRALKATHEDDLASQTDLAGQLTKLQEELNAAQEEPKKADLAKQIAAAQKQLEALQPAIAQRTPELAKLEKESAALKTRYLEALK